jgi:hypothetical protein
MPTSSIVWCETPVKFEYNLSIGANCDEPVQLTSTRDSYNEFSEKIIDVLSHRSALVLFKHIHGYYYGDRSKSTMNQAYTLMKWGILNLKPNLDDLWLEFGVSAGNSINLTATMRGEKVKQPTYGFDAFKGLDEDWEGRMALGTFTRNGSIPHVHHNVELKVGWFNQTLEPFLAAHPGEFVGHVNIDMDLFRGAFYVLKQLIPRFRPGTVLHFHEFFRHNASTNVLTGEAEMKALYYAMKRSSTPVRLQLMPFHSRWREPAVFRVC